MTPAMAETITLPAPTSCVPRPRKRKRRKRTSLIADFQDVLLTGAMAEDTPLPAVASAANAFVSLESLRREILGLGKPKPVDPVNADKGKSKRKPAVPIADAP